jgi:hypothetical protein
MILAKAEISFTEFPCGARAARARDILRAVDGMIEVSFDPSVSRARLHFDPALVDLGAALSRLAPLQLRPRIVSVIVPATP